MGDEVVTINGGRRQIEAKKMRPDAEAQGRIA
jgi:hypothetical protein